MSTIGWMVTTAAAIAITVALPGAGEPLAAAPAAGAAEAKPPATMFLLISGHSLTDHRLARSLEALLSERGARILWDLHAVEGSSIRQRLAKHLKDGNGVPDHTRSSNTHDGDSDVSDVLIVTEQHRILDALAWEGTSSSLRRLQEWFATQRPDGKSFFLTPWISRADLDDTDAWVRYERAAHIIWDHVIARVNERLRQQGQNREIQVIPAALGLAFAVEALRSGEELEGFDGHNRNERVEALFDDQVHLSPLGVFYLSVLTAMVLTDTKWHSDISETAAGSGLDERQARQLVRLAEQFLERYGARPAVVPDPTLTTRFSFILQYLHYTDRAYGWSGTNQMMRPVRKLVRFVRLGWRFRNGFTDP
nr:hypothetical protein RTCK_00416 [Rhizobium sp. TCK]CAD6618511.1 hypothetical protein RNT25_03640 [arsenite-oxidising bacterium NT-25]